jgi:hypothetical protein
MQRKNSILKSSRDGIAMIMAIAVIVIMATIMALSLSMTATTTKRTVDLYTYEQSILLSKSATEYALLRIAQDGPCSHINDLNFNQDSIYDINITNRYVYTNPLPAGCPADTIVVQTPEQNGSVIMDVTVSVPTTANVTTEPIRFFKRTIQKL